MWRPKKGWENPYRHYEIPPSRPIKDVICEEECNVGNYAYEAGADAMLEAIWKMAKESPTGTFIFDTNTINIFSEKEQ